MRRQQRCSRLPRVPVEAVLSPAVKFGVEQHAGTMALFCPNFYVHLLDFLTNFLCAPLRPALLLIQSQINWTISVMPTTTTLSKADIETRVIAVLSDMTADWDLEINGGIGPQVRLMRDLSFESIDVVQFVVSIEQNLDRKGIPFEKLFMRDGDYVEDLQVSEIVDFLHAQISAR
jgi:acyl carrier protein